MAAITVTTGLSDLQTLFNEAKEVYYCSTALSKTTLASLSTINMELPVLSGGINFDTGSADTTIVKLTTGANWAAKVSKGDPDITLQIASIAGTVNDMFMDKKSGAQAVSMTNTLSGKTFAGAGYSLSPKKVAGALLFLSQSRDTLIVLPNVEMYASLVAADGDNPAYFNVAVTPLEDTDGCDIYVMKATA